MRAATDQRVNPAPSSDLAHWGVDTKLTLAYLSAPAFIFLVLFVKPLLALPLSALLLVAFVKVTWRLESAPYPWFAAAVGAIIVAIIAGFPFGPFPWDWFKHWALLSALSGPPWSLRIDVGGSPMYLRFYLAAYIVPALAHDLLPVFPLWMTTGAWFALGFGLVLHCAARWVPDPRLAWKSALLILSLGGADYYAGNVLRAVKGFPLHLNVDLHPELWASAYMGVPLEFSSFLTALVWVPHQSIATFLVASMLANTNDHRGLPGAMLAYGMLSVWSPFGMIGLLPLMAARMFQNRRCLVNADVIITSIAAAAFSLSMVGYLSTDLQSKSLCFHCVPIRLLLEPREILSFLAVELIPFVLLLGRRVRADIVCRISLVTLLFIPFAYGDGPDFVMRASMGPLFVLGLHCVHTFLNDEAESRRRAIRWMALALCVPAAVSEAVYLREAGQAHRTVVQASDPLGVRWVRTFAARTDYTIQEFFDTCGWQYLNQYFSEHKPSIIRDTQ
jgi:hypothetical protein